MAYKITKIGLSAFCLFQIVSCSKDASLQEKEVRSEKIEELPTIEVSEEESTPVLEDKVTLCETLGGYANQTGLKSWCWQDEIIPEYTEKKGVGFSDGFLHVDSECYEKQVLVVNDKIKFSVNPVYPATDSWCSRDYNMRAEIRTAPWDVRHEIGTEEWFGWTYTFGNNYIVDKESQWKFFQIHNGVTGQSPQIGLEIINAHQFKEHSAGEVYVTVSGDIKNYTPTAVIPKAGQTIKVVVHVVYGDKENGLLQTWFNSYINLPLDMQLLSSYDIYSGNCLVGNFCKRFVFSNYWVL